MDTSVQAHDIRPSVVPSRPRLTLGHVEGNLHFVLGHTETYESILIGQLVDVLRPNNERFIQVKVRCVDVRYGQCPFQVRGWHYDHVVDYLDPSPHERHAIFSTGIPTLFRPVENDPDHILATEPGRIYTYGRVLHKPSHATREQRRLFIRISEGDVVRPTNKVRGRS